MQRSRLWNSNWTLRRIRCNESYRNETWFELVGTWCWHTVAISTNRRRAVGRRAPPIDTTWLSAVARPPAPPSPSLALKPPPTNKHYSLPVHARLFDGSLEAITPFIGSPSLAAYCNFTGGGPPWLRWTLPDGKKIEIKRPSYIKFLATVLNRRHESSLWSSRWI